PRYRAPSRWLPAATAPASDHPPAHIRTSRDIAYIPRGAYPSRPPLPLLCEELFRSGSDCRSVSLHPDRDRNKYSRLPPLIPRSYNNLSGSQVPFVSARLPTPVPHIIIHIQPEE